MRFRHVLTIAMTSAAVVGAGALAAAEQGGKARAELKDPKGQVVGQAQLTETPHGVLITAKLSNVPPGVHAFHVHTTGKCDPPGFDSAGGHFNPAKAMHGFQNAKGPHAGDMPNVHVGKDGTLDVEVLARGASMSDGPNNLFDADGAALVLHAGADDYSTDPSGNAGGRIACGVIQK